jgi:hypothetical protein
MNDRLSDELTNLIAALEQPLSSDELANGWTSQAQVATLTVLRKFREAVGEGQAPPDVSGGGRALDHWGVVDGPLLEAVCAFCNHVAQSGE